ncbi:MAG: hypothetical protein WCK65_16155 [Rhodospirillaceae bacterium]
MQISPPNSAVAAALSGKSTGHDARSNGTLDDLTATRTVLPAPTQVETKATDSVSISPEVRSLEISNTAVPIYAEIWKGSIKVAQVDAHGHVISHSGMVAPSSDGGVGGPLIAAQRAVQVAQMVGGEIRSAGQALDSQTLLMRARLANTYVS